MSQQFARLGRFRVVVLGHPPVLTNVEHNLGASETFKVVTYYREPELRAHCVKQFSMHKELRADTFRYSHQLDAVPLQK